MSELDTDRGRDRGDPRRPDDHRRRRRRSRERGRPDHGRRHRHARAGGVHGPPHQRHPVHADAGRRCRAPAPAADGERQRRAACRRRSRSRSTTATGSPPASRPRSAPARSERWPTAMSGPEDFVRPGHIFPLIARDGGVLIRSGHTEAAVDLCRLAGVETVGVLAELVNDDGTVKRLPACREFAKAHGLKIVSIADLIEYRQRRDQLVQACRHLRDADADRPGHRHRLRDAVRPDPARGTGLRRPGRRRARARANPSRAAAGRHPGRRRRRGRAGAGPHRPRAARRLPAAARCGGAASQPATPGRCEEEHESAQRRMRQWREVGIGAQILRDLGIVSIHLLAAHRRHYIGLSGFGIEIAETELLEQLVALFRIGEAEGGQLVQDRPRGRVRAVRDVGLQRRARVVPMRVSRPARGPAPTKLRGGIGADGGRGGRRPQPQGGGAVPVVHEVATVLACRDAARGGVPPNRRTSGKVALR